jgi:hypothetical protein
MSPRPQQVQQNPFDLLMTVILPSNLATRGGGGGGSWSLLDYASAKILVICTFLQSVCVSH